MSGNASYAGDSERKAVSRVMLWRAAISFAAPTASRPVVTLCGQGLDADLLLRWGIPADAIVLADTDDRALASAADRLPKGVRTHHGCVSGVTGRVSIAMLDFCGTLSQRRFDVIADYADRAAAVGYVFGYGRTDSAEIVVNGDAMNAAWRRMFSAQCWALDNTEGMSRGVRRFLAAKMRRREVQEKSCRAVLRTLPEATGMRVNNNRILVDPRGNEDARPLDYTFGYTWKRGMRDDAMAKAMSRAEALHEGLVWRGTPRGHERFPLTAFELRYTGHAMPMFGGLYEMVDYSAVRFEREAAKPYPLWDLNKLSKERAIREYAAMYQLTSAEVSRDFGIAPPRARALVAHATRGTYTKDAV